MKETIRAVLHHVHGSGSMIPAEVTHHIALEGNRQAMWEMFWAIAAELQRDHTFHSRDPKNMDLAIDLYVEVTHGLD